MCDWALEGGGKKPEVKEHTVTNVPFWTHRRQGKETTKKKLLLQSCCYFKPVDFQSLHMIRSDGMGRKRAPYSWRMSDSNVFSTTLDISESN